MSQTLGLPTQVLDTQEELTSSLGSIYSLLRSFMAPPGTPFAFETLDGC